MLIDQLKTDLISAQKEKATLRVGTLRFLLSAVNNFAIDKYGAAKDEKPIPDEEVIAVIRKLSKERQESIEAFKKGNRPDLVEKEQKELTILASYLPPEMGEEEIEKVVKDVIAAGATNFGAVMGKAMGMLKGKVSGDRVAEVVKRNLAQG